MPFLPMVLVAPIEPSMLVFANCAQGVFLPFWDVWCSFVVQRRMGHWRLPFVESRAPSSLRACRTPVPPVSPHLFPPLSSLFSLPLYPLIAHSISLSLAIVRSPFFVLSSFFLLVVVTALISSITFAD